MALGASAAAQPKGPPTVPATAVPPGTAGAPGTPGAPGAPGVPAVPAVPTYPPGYDPVTHQRSYSQHALVKIRPGSYLHGEGPVDEAPEDLRGTLEQQRDAEVIKHFTRLAELDVIEEVAEKSHDLTLAEHVEEVRRKEVQRFREMMETLHNVVRDKQFGDAR